MDKILLIDGMNFIWRGAVSFGTGFVPVTPFTKTAEDQPDYQVVFSFFRNLRPIVEQFKPNKVFIAFEGHPNHRYALYPAYKANRITKLAAEKLKPGKSNTDKVMEASLIIKELLQYFPITLASHPEYEADDIVNTLCHDLKTEDLTVVSSDTDYIQLLQDPELSNIKIYDAKKKEYMVAPPYVYLCYKSIRGDKSDNIAGLKGEKTSQKIASDPQKLQEFLSVEENRANFNLNKELIELKKVPMEEVMLKTGVSNWDRVKEEFEKMEFQSITNDKSWEKFTSTFNSVKFDD